ncbi:MAG: hypothetical protein ACPL7O_13390, partial [Armatimonadota bacterium]
METRQIQEPLSVGINCQDCFRILSGKWALAWRVRVSVVGAKQCHRMVRNHTLADDATSGCLPNMQWYKPKRAPRPLRILSWAGARITLGVMNTPNTFASEDVQWNFSQA